MKRFLSSVAPFFGGVLFAIGLGVGGMTQPSKIVGFLDILGNWDPTLIFVMGGAVIVYAVSYRLITKRNAPFFSEQFHLPTRRDIDVHLVLGAAIFGAGWGLSGLCPGPGITAFISGAPEVIIFVTFMLVGMFTFLSYEELNKRFG